MNPKSTLIPDFIRARNPSELRRLMFMRNVKDGIQYVYQNPQYVLEKKVGYWYVWFFRDISTTQDMTNILSEVDNQNPSFGEQL